MDAIIQTESQIQTAECVGCGYCCMKAPCAASSRLYPGVTHCPQLVWSDDLSRYLCKLALLPGEVGERYRKELAINAGCSSSLFNTWREDVHKRSVTEASPYDHVSNPIPPDFQLFLGILANQWVSGDLLYLTALQLQERLEKDLHYTKEEAAEYIVHVLKIFNENRKSYVKDFMG